MSAGESEAGKPLEPTVEHVGEDRLELWRRAVRATEAQIEEQRPIVAEERRAAAQAIIFGIRDTLYFRVVKLNTREGQRDRYRAICISGLPESSMSVQADATTAEDAVHEGRFAFAESLYKAKVCASWEASKLRASKAELFIADIVR